jgi:protein SCO1/2
VKKTALLILLVLLATPLFARQDRPAALDDVGIDQRLNQQVPLSLTFRDETGKSVKLGDYFGDKPVILTLVYYECPMLCTYTLNGLVRSMQALPFDLGRQYRVVTVSFNPHEGPALAAAKKKEYLSHYSRSGGAEGWHFLTGDAPSIEKLADAVGFRYHYDAETRQYAHAAGLMVLTPQGKIARYFYGVEFSPRDLRLALDEASADRIGSPVDEVLLFCFHYDPATGKYGLLITRMIQIAGAGTVLIIALFIGLMLRRERAAKPGVAG